MPVRGAGPAKVPVRLFPSPPASRWLIAAPLLLLPLAGCMPPPHPPVSSCWIQIFEQPNCTPAGRHDLLFGPARWDTLENLPNSQLDDWTGAIASLITGPEAAAILWENGYFGGRRVRVAPDGQLYGIPLPRVGSLAIECQDESR